MKFLLFLLLMQPLIKMKYVNQSKTPITISFISSGVRAYIAGGDSILDPYRPLTASMLRDSIMVEYGDYYQRLPPISDTIITSGSYRCVFTHDLNTNAWSSKLTKEDRP